MIAATVMVVGAPERGSTAASTDFEPWAQTARLAGASVWAGMTQTQVNNVITNMNAQNVSVIEADSNLSNYMTDAEFNQELALMHGRQPERRHGHRHADEPAVVHLYDR